MLSDKRVRRNKETLGAELKEARMRAGYTQKALASALGLEYYTMISQMELGYMAIPPTLWIPITRTLHMETERWVLTCLKEYQPDVYEALFLKRSLKEVATILSMFNKGSFDDLLQEKKHH